MTYEEALKNFVVPLPDDKFIKSAKQISLIALQQAQFEISQQKLNSQLALQIAQITVKEAK